MNKAKANLWLFNKKTKDFTFSYEVKEKFRFIKGSLLAVISGLIVGGIIIAIKNVNPFEYLKWLFTIGFNDVFTSRTISWLCIYIVAALAVGIGFKSGMFNIGVSGQMMMGGGIAIIYYKLGVDKISPAGYAMNLMPNAGQIILIFLICVGSGAIIAGIAGLLKALFNIHEVVTTIMLNYATFYLMKYLFTTFQSISGQGIQASGQIPGNSLTINGSTIAIPIIIAIIAVIVISVLLAKSTFGFKIKAIGASPSASKYAGYDVRKKMVEAMLISGALAGCASFISIFTIAPQYTFNSDALPSTGYDAVAITLVAFNNPIGTVFSSFLWAVLQSAGSSAASMFNLPTQMSQLIFGIIVYFAAISVVFINWYPILKLKIMIAMTGNKANQIKVKNLRNQELKCRNELMQISKAKDVQDYKKFIEEQIAEQKKLLKDSSKTEKQIAEAKENIRSLKKEMNDFVKEYRKNLKEQIKKCSEQIKIIKKENYVEKINSARQGIDKREFDATREVEQDALSKASLVKSNLLGLKDKYTSDLKARKYWLTNKLHSLKKEYKLKLKQNAVWMESETGEKNHYWEMRNGKIESKATINKMKIAAHNHILNIKSDAEIEELTLNSKYRNKPETLKKKIDVLEKKTKAEIAKTKLKLKKDIKSEQDHVKELIKTYNDTKKANEELARKIVAKKKSFNSKLYKQSPIDKELVHDSDALLKELYFENQRDKKAVEKINIHNDTEGASLVDIRLAYNERKRDIDEWYKAECKHAVDKHEAFVKQYNDEHSSEQYEKAKVALNEFETKSKKLGDDNNNAVIEKKRKLLDQAIVKIKTIWPEEYSNTDPIKWSKKRLSIYKKINKYQAELANLSIVYNANMNIVMIKAKAKYIRKMYNVSIKDFKNQYDKDKKFDLVKAQANYHNQVEKFISKLENTKFTYDQLQKEA